MNVAITGATGHLGAAVLRELFRNDHRVKTLIRSDDKRACDGLPVQIVKGDLHDEKALHQLMQNCDALVHCAGLISVHGDPKGLVHQTNVEGTKFVMKMASQSGIKRFIHISSIHAFKQKPSYEMLDEKRDTVSEKAFAYDHSKKL